MAEATAGKSEKPAAATPVLTAFVKVNRKINASSGDERLWSVELGTADDDRNGDWAPDGRPAVLTLPLSVSGDIGDALDMTKTYRLTLEQVD